MTVAFGAIGTGDNNAAGDTSLTPSYPTGITAGQLLLCAVSSGEASNTAVATPNGWFLLGTNWNTTGSWGLDTGPRRITVFGRVADGSESGTLSVTIQGTTSETARATISRFTSSIGSGWALQVGTGNDSSAGTGVSINCGSINWATGDCAFVAVAQLMDASTQSSQSLTASGTTFGTRTNRASTAVTAGNDHRHVVDTFAAVTAGGGSATTTWAYTASSSSTQAAAVVVRIREIGDIAEALTVTVEQTATFVEGPKRVVNELLIGSAVQASLRIRRVGIGEAVVIGYDKSTAESLTVSDSATERADFSATCAEAITLTESSSKSLNSVFSKQRDETLTLTDDQSEIVTLNSTANEAIAVSDASSAGLTPPRTVNEVLIGAPAYFSLLGRRVGIQEAASAFYSKQVDEALTVSESSAKTAALNSAVGESITVAESQAASVNPVYQKQRDEALTLTDASSRSLTTPQFVAEAIAVSDASFLVVPKSVNERLIGSAIQRAAMRVAANDVSVARRDEALTVTAAQSATKVVVTAQANTLTITDSVAGSAIKSSAISEALTLTESSIQFVVGAGKSVTETLTLTEASSSYKSYFAVADESVAVSEAQAHDYQQAPPRVNALLVGERREGLLQPWAMDAVASVRVDESLSVSDFATQTRSIQAARQEVLTLTDAQSEIGQFNAAVDESIALTVAQDGSSAGLVYAKQTDESLVVTDAQSLTVDLNFTVQESIVLVDASASVSVIVKQCDESITLTDSSAASLQPVHNRVQHESLILTDVQVATVNNPVFIAQQHESLAVTDSVSQIPSINSSITEQLTISESSSSVGAFVRFMSEALGITDALYIQSGVLSEFYQYDVPGGSLQYDVPGEAGALRYDVEVEAMEISI